MADTEWTIRYLECMMTENYEEAFALKGKYCPAAFFKYKVLNSQAIESIEKNNLWLSEISSLNDPFECSLQFDNDECLRHFYADAKFHAQFRKMTGYSLSEEEIKRLGSSSTPYTDYVEICLQKDITIEQTGDDFIKKVRDRWTEIIEESNNGIKVSCFSTLNDSLLMWAHYADQHKGICIEYDLMNEDNIRPFLQPIIYRDEVFKLGLLEDLTILKKVGSTLIKSKTWEYEGEWRITMMKQGDDFPSTISVEKPKAIYLGTRFSQNKSEDKLKLFSMAANLKIPVLQMVKHPTEFRLVSEP